jgi:chromosome segregation ATPase
MARHGITYEDVVSVENVRRFLGTGSAGTVNQHLRLWKEAQNSTLKIASKENLPEGLISLVKGLWEGVLAQSTELFTPIETNYQQEISELKTELEKYRNNNQRWQKLFNQWQQEKAQLANEKLTLEQALEFTHKENTSLQAKLDALHQQLEEKNERISELHLLHKQAQENLEHYRETAREQRLLDQQQYEQTKQQLQSEIKNFNEHLVIQREKNSELQQQNKALLQNYSGLEKNHAQVHSQLEQIKNKLTESEKMQNMHLQSSQHWQSQFKEMQKTLENKTSELATTQTEYKITLQQSLDAKQLLQDAQGQNKLLTNEKWVLSQEKAQLEGQLKQMQKLISA